MINTKVKMLEARVRELEIANKLMADNLVLLTNGMTESFKALIDKLVECNVFARKEEISEE